MILFCGISSPAAAMDLFTQSKGRSMKPAFKAALLSGLVFPGLGQLILRQYLKAGVFAAVSIAVLYVLVSQAITKAEHIVAKLSNAAALPDLLQVSQLMNEAISPAEAQIANWLTLALLIVWLAAIVDALRSSPPGEGKSDQHAED
jgi:hypothetical protein